MNPLIAYLKNFHEIPSADAETISRHFEIKSFKEGDTVFKAGKICKALFFICKGVLRINTSNEKGIDITHYFFKENQVCTILQSFKDETPTEAGIMAATDATVMLITKTNLLNLYTLVPYMKELIENINQQHLIDKVNVRNSYVGLAAENQYRLFIKQQPDIALRVSLKDIASYLGITPQSLSRIRKNIR